MKFFIFIFSIYILALAMMPCSDAITCENEKHSMESTSSNHDHSSDKEDLCSPFCICSCCGGTLLVVNAPYFFIEKVKLEAPQFITPYYSDLHSSYYHSFWQPPKLS